MVIVNVICNMISYSYVLERYYNKNKIMNKIDYFARKTVLFSRFFIFTFIDYYEIKQQMGRVNVYHSTPGFVSSLVIFMLRDTQTYLEVLIDFRLKKSYCRIEPWDVMIHRRPKIYALGMSW